MNVIRGKPKIGYDLNYEILFENEEGEEGVLKVTEQMDDDNEGQIEIEDCENDDLKRTLERKVGPALMQEVAAVM